MYKTGPGEEDGQDDGGGLSTVPTVSPRCGLRKVALP